MVSSGRLFCQKKGVEDRSDEKMMKAAYLPGNSTVVLRDVEIPTPGTGVLLK